jgi:hypothetical protein
MNAIVDKQIEIEKNPLKKNLNLENLFIICQFDYQSIESLSVGRNNRVGKANVSIVPNL